MSGFLGGHFIKTKALANKKDFAVVAIDLTKAFDSICHNLLLAKLKAYGIHDKTDPVISIRPKVSDWLHASSLWSATREPSRSASSEYLCEWCQLLSWIFLPTFVWWWHHAIYSPWEPVHTRIYIESRYRETFWFTANYLQVNGIKTQAMTLGKSQYPYNLYIGDKSIAIEPTLKIFGVTLDQDLSFKLHVTNMLKKSVC